MKNDYPVQKTLALLRSEGKIVTSTSHWNSFTNQRKDLFGIFDLLCIDPGNKMTIGVQVTTKNGRSAHKKKIREAAIFSPWLTCGNQIHLYSWFKNEKSRWQFLFDSFTLDEGG